jgi:hypothetical protein
VSFSTWWMVGYHSTDGNFGVKSTFLQNIFQRLSRILSISGGVYTRNGAQWSMPVCWGRWRPVSQWKFDENRPRIDWDGFWGIFGQRFVTGARAYISLSVPSGRQMDTDKEWITRTNWRKRDKLFDNGGVLLSLHGWKFRWNQQEVTFWTFSSKIFSVAFKHFFDISGVYTRNGAHGGLSGHCQHVWGNGGLVPSENSMGIASKLTEMASEGIFAKGSGLELKTYFQPELGQFSTGFYGGTTTIWGKFRRWRVQKLEMGFDGWDSHTASVQPEVRFYSLQILDPAHSKQGEWSYL